MLKNIIIAIITPVYSISTIRRIIFIAPSIIALSTVMVISTRVRVIINVKNLTV